MEEAYAPWLDIHHAGDEALEILMALVNLHLPTDFCDEGNTSGKHIDGCNDEYGGLGYGDGFPLITWLNLL